MKDPELARRKVHREKPETKKKRVAKIQKKIKQSIADKPKGEEEETRLWIQHCCVAC